MNHWTPLFSKIVDSSIWAEPDNVCKVFITMMALKDHDHVVRYNAFGLAQRCHKTEAEVLEALRVLSSADNKRIEPQAHEGRRIERVEGGWLMLNGEVYKELMQNLNRKVYQAAKQKEYRANKRALREAGSGPLGAEAASVKAQENGMPIERVIEEEAEVRQEIREQSGE